MMRNSIVESFLHNFRGRSLQFRVGAARFKVEELERRCEETKTFIEKMSAHRNPDNYSISRALDSLQEEQEAIRILNNFV